MKWKLQQPKYESNQGPGTTQNQMVQKTKGTDQEQEAQAPSTLGFWPTGSEMSVCCCIVLWLWLQLHLALVFRLFIFFFLCLGFSVFFLLLPAAFDQAMHCRPGQGVFTACSVCFWPCFGFVRCNALKKHFCGHCTVAALLLYTSCYTVFTYVQLTQFPRDLYLFFDPPTFEYYGDAFLLYEIQI